MEAATCVSFFRTVVAFSKDALLKAASIARMPSSPAVFRFGSLCIDFSGYIDRFVGFMASYRRTHISEPSMCVRRTHTDGQFFTWLYVNH